MLLSTRGIQQLHCTRDVYITQTLYEGHARFLVGSSQNRSRVTARERADAMLLREGMNCRAGVLRCRSLSMLADITL
jgi:hypothetical protein